MYVLDSATKIITITASAACDVTVSGFRDSTTPPSFSYQTKVGAGETKTICPAGSAAAPRNIDNISVTNTGAANTISVKMDDTGSPDVATILSSMVLAASEKGQYTHANGWDTIDANAAKKRTQSGVAVASGKTLTVSETITLTAAGAGQTFTLPATSATIARTDAGQTFTGTNTFGALTLTGNVGVTGTPTFTLTGCSFTAGALVGTSLSTGSGAISGGAGTFTTGTFSGVVNVGGSVVGAGIVRIKPASAAGVGLLVDDGGYGLYTIGNNELNFNYNHNGADSVLINYHGYQGGTTQFRNFEVYDGKTNLLLGIAASTGAVTIPGTLGVTGALTAASLSTGSGAISGGAGTFTTVSSTSSAADWTASVVNTHASTPYGLLVNFSGADPNGTGNQFFLAQGAASALRAEIRSNGGLANYSANNVNLSDANAKRVKGAAPDYTDMVERLAYKRFSYKDAKDETDDIIAQDVAALDPDLVTEWANGLKGVYTYRLQQRINSVVPRLIARIKALEAKLQ